MQDTDYVPALLRKMKQRIGSRTQLFAWLTSLRGVKPDARTGMQQRGIGTYWGSGLHLLVNCLLRLQLLSTGPLSSHQCLG